MTLPRRRRGARGPQRALGLVEVVAATAVLTIFLLGMFSALATNQLAEVENRERQAASEYALRQLDLVTELADIDGIARNASNQETTAVTSYGFDVPYGADTTVLPSANPGEKAGRIFVIERGSYDDDDSDDDVDGDDSQDLLEVRAEVRWRSANGGGVNELEVVTWKVRG